MEELRNAHTRLFQDHPAFLASNSAHGYVIYIAPLYLPLRGAAGEQIKTKDVLLPESVLKKLTYLGKELPQPFFLHLFSLNSSFTAMQLLLCTEKLQPGASSI
jgi:hypothetical protein